MEIQISPKTLEKLVTTSSRPGGSEIRPLAKEHVACQNERELTRKRDLRGERAEPKEP